MRTAIEIIKALRARSAIEWRPGTESNELCDLLREAAEHIESTTPKDSVWCKHCPFAEHVHYEENGKRVAPGCSGFEVDLREKGNHPNVGAGGGDE